MKLLAATDYDGTINIHGEVSAENRSAIRAWRESGRYFGVVTGRGMDFYDTASDIGLEYDFLLVHTGAQLVLPDGSVVKEHRIPRDDFSLLENFFSLVSRRDVLSCSETGEGEVFHQYYARAKDQKTALVYSDKLNALFGDRITAYVNGPHINICAAGIGKTSGVYDALEYFGLPRDAAAVFGDDYNDREMIINHSGWMMSTAPAELLAEAPHVCDSVWEVLNSLLQAGKGE